MNCKNCNSPLEPQARFCAGCGTPVTGNTTVSAANQTMPAAPMWSQSIEATKSFPPQEPMPLVVNPQSLSQQNYAPQDEHFSPTAPLSENGQLQRKKRKGRLGLGGCLLILVTILVLLVGTLAGVWFFAIRPPLHDMVVTKLDSKMGQVVDRLNIPPQLQLPPRPTFLPPPPPLTVPVTEDQLTSAMKLTSSSSDPVKDLVFHITEQNVRVEFSVQPDFLPFLSIPCAVSFVPTVDDQGNITVTHLNIEGLATLIVTSDDITPIINRHLKDASTKLHNAVSRIDLQSGTILITITLK